MDSGNLFGIISTKINFNRSNKKIIMKKNFTQCIKGIALLCVCTTLIKPAIAQTDMDAIMMDKKNLCGGFMYGFSSWKNYWEGDYKRDNQNIGTISTQSTAVMGNYGINEKLNIIFSLPYIQTNASAGTLKGMKGFQDLSLYIKYMPLEKKIGKGTLSLYGIGGYSFPVSNYVADFLPLAIGLRSKVITGRIMADYQRGKFFVTASGTYNYRNNIKIDRTAYYTTQMHLTNEVEMPDVISYNIRTGYRSNYLIAEAIYNNMVTQDGFDIRKNDMPFPSNKMNMGTAGINIKYTLKNLPALSLIAGGNTVLQGRNVGQATGFYGGVFYIVDFAHKKLKAAPNGKTRNDNK
jgi:hypothetical protein